jgi:hypothetical protein
VQHAGGRARRWPHSVHLRKSSSQIGTILALSFRRLVRVAGFSVGQSSFLMQERGFDEARERNVGRYISHEMPAQVVDASQSPDYHPPTSRATNYMANDIKICQRES